MLPRTLLVLLAFSFGGPAEATECYRGEMLLQSGMRIPKTSRHIYKGPDVSEVKVTGGLVIRKMALGGESTELIVEATDDKLIIVAGLKTWKYVVKRDWQRNTEKAVFQRRTRRDSPLGKHEFYHFTGTEFQYLAVSYGRHKEYFSGSRFYLGDFGPCRRRSKLIGSASFTVQTFDVQADSKPQNIPIPKSKKKFGKETRKLCGQVRHRSKKWRLYNPCNKSGSVGVERSNGQHRDCLR